MSEKMDANLKNLFEMRLSNDIEERRKYLAGIDEIKQDYKKRRLELLDEIAKIEADPDIKEVLRNYGSESSVYAQPRPNTRLITSTFRGLLFSVRILGECEALGFLNSEQELDLEYGFFNVTQKHHPTHDMFDQSVFSIGFCFYSKTELSKLIYTEPHIPGYCDVIRKSNYNSLLPSLPNPDEIMPVLLKPGKLTELIEDEIRKLLEK